MDDKLEKAKTLKVEINEIEDICSAIRKDGIYARAINDCEGKTYKYYKLNIGNVEQTVLSIYKSKLESLKSEYESLWS